MAVIVVGARPFELISSIERTNERNDRKINHRNDFRFALRASSPLVEIFLIELMRSRVTRPTSPVDSAPPGYTVRDSH